MSSSEPQTPQRSPASIAQLVEVISQLTQLVKDQAADLRASKRLAQLLRAQEKRFGQRPTGDFPLHHSLEQIPMIIDDLHDRFVQELLRAAEEDSRPFSQLGLTDESEAWRLKYEASQVASRFAESPPPSRIRRARSRNDVGRIDIAEPSSEGEPASSVAVSQPGSERKLRRRLKKREAALSLGNSVVGSATTAIPVVGAAIGEAYGEIKDHAEELDKLVRAIGSGVMRPIRRIIGR